jgi:ABC-type polysaccharide/polyol phosphate transport system ATPase subunit
MRGRPDPLLKVDAQPSNLSTFQPSNVNDTIWALRAVSFQVQQGEVVGIPSAELGACPECNEGTGIGRNGAGKSTLTSAQLSARLKILSRVTESPRSQGDVRRDELSHVRTGVVI